MVELSVWRTGPMRLPGEPKSRLEIELQDIAAAIALYETARWPEGRTPGVKG